MAIHGAPSVHNMMGLSQDMHVHMLGRHVHSGIMRSLGQLCWLVACIKL